MDGLITVLRNGLTRLAKDLLKYYTKSQRKNMIRKQEHGDGQARRCSFGKSLKLWVHVDTSASHVDGHADCHARPALPPSSIYVRYVPSLHEIPRIVSTLKALLAPLGTDNSRLFCSLDHTVLLEYSSNALPFKDLWRTSRPSCSRTSRKAPEHRLRSRISHGLNIPEDQQQV